MSRLYMWAESDMRKTDLTARGNKYIEVTINYGSRCDSKTAIIVRVDFPRNALRPKITMYVSHSVEVRANRAINS